ncbi:hypothetical protein WAI453_006444 [Rhynchosporium graminicola]
MSAYPENAPSSYVRDAHELTSSNFRPDSPTSQPSTHGHSASRDIVSENQKLYEVVPFNTLSHATAELYDIQNMSDGVEGETSREYSMKKHSQTDKQADYQSINCDARNSQFETFKETCTSVSSTNNVEMLVREEKTSPGPLPLLSGAGLQAGATSGTEVPHFGIENALETLRSGGLKERRQEQISQILAADNTGSSDDSGPGSKKLKVDCDCDNDHTSWMTIKIDNMNEALHQIDDARSLVWKLAFDLNDLYNNTIHEVLGHLKNSWRIVDSAKDDMRAEGGFDREATE